MKKQAQEADQNDSLRQLRTEFELPVGKVYFCGNSLGPLPKRVRILFDRELNKWKDQAVEGHFLEPNPWVFVNEICINSMARLVGAKPIEVAVMNSLTVNIHLLLVSFYQPLKEKKKILIEKNAFPSDIYAVHSHVNSRGLNSTSVIIEKNLSEIEQEISKDSGKEICLVFLGGVNYQTGEVVDMKKITDLCHSFDILVGFDLAHAVGNVELQLSAWDVDFACWCTYKYLNSGPGGIAGIFVREKHFSRPRLEGWWGNEKSTRFKMENVFVPEVGAAAWQLSNPPVFQTVSLRASLDIFDKVNRLEDMFEKSRKLTDFLEKCLTELLPNDSFTIMTPKKWRGCQLSLVFHHENIHEIHAKITDLGFICDKREPNVLRVAPAPLFNGFTEVFQFALALKSCLSERIKSNL